MSVFESIKVLTGLDQFVLANALFFAMVLLTWLVIVILEQRDSYPLPPQAHGSDGGAPGLGRRWANRYRQGPANLPFKSYRSSEAEMTVYEMDETVAAAIARVRTDPH